ncbi:hypothetical protein M2171_007569 [Bradyrhizobium japonicum USDA 38]|uniref:hypothetical protein n=1 Tax=Bradyrhizobium japonicum TaxID=375 RepID=UPI0004032C4B|nr:hypothetical protein [Bradyrhizobium japonicum]MCS3898436.1 hypothetical protein [Bradyrhizobium japonicum USDA 38]MCS3941489.1 hypothetical protein [Bradyrhizobium japonicum]
MLNGEIAAHAYLSAASTQLWKKLSYRHGNLCGRIGQKNARGIAGRNARGRYDHSGSEWRARFPEGQKDHQHYIDKKLVGSAMS